MGATDYFEMPGSPTETINIESGECVATRTFECDWADRYTVRAYLLSYNTGLYEYDTVFLPVSCSIAPFGEKNIAESALNKKSLYDKAILTVQYKVYLGYATDPAGAGNVTGAEFVSQSIGIEAQFLSVTSGKLWWDDSPHASALADGQAPEKRIYVKKYAITLHRIATIPAEFDSLIGTVNVAAYNTVKRNGTDTAYQRAIGNLLYEGYSITRSIGSLGVISCDATLQFAEIMNGAASNAWNYFWNPNTHEWSRIYRTGQTTPATIYASADWTNLGLPPQT